MLKGLRSARPDSAEGTHSAVDDQIINSQRAHRMRLEVKTEDREQRGTEGSQGS